MKSTQIHYTIRPAQTTTNSGILRIFPKQSLKLVPVFLGNKMLKLKNL